MITLTAVDLYPGTLTWTVDTQPLNGTLSGTAPVLTYMPAANYYGSDSFTFKVSDGTVVSNIATVTITVAAVNDAPVTEDITAQTDEDTPVAIKLVASDVDGNEFTFSIVTQPAHGALSGTAPAFTYTPALNYNGTDSFTYKASDGELESEPATVTITVAAVNDAPVANNMNVTTAEDTAKAITLDASDVDGDSLTATIVAQPTHGTVSLSGLVATYTPTANYNGTDSFTYKVNDSTVDSNIATVSITVAAVNDAPVAENASVETDEDTPVEIELVASDVDGDELTFTVVTQPAHGTLSGTAPALTYTPALNYNGEDSFTFKANDSTVDSNIATVSITIATVNDAPVAKNVTAETEEDTSVEIELVASDVDGDELTFAVVTQPAHGTLSGTAPALTYAPEANFNGTDSFTFKANDGTVDSNEATVSITVAAVNDAPVANNMNVITAEDTAKAITLDVSDIDGDTLTATIVAQPQHGTVDLIGLIATYTPAADYYGLDSFTYKVNDGTVDSNIATVTVTVTAVNDAPVAEDVSAETNEDTPVEIELVASDVDGDELEFIIVTQPAHGTLSGTAPDLTYTPALNYNGEDSFTFKANDSTVDSNVATVEITIAAVNDAPVAEDVSAETNEDTPVEIELVASDVEGDELSAEIVDEPAHGDVTIEGLIATYTPEPDFNGTDSFTYKVFDGALYSNESSATITITPVNDAPLANTMDVTTAEDTAKEITLDASDVDEDTLTATIIAGPSHGTAVVDGIVVTYTPAVNYNGSDSFVYRVNDGYLSSNLAVVYITVTPVNDAPVSQNISTETDEDTPVEIELVASDVDGDELTAEIVTDPLHGEVTLEGFTVIYAPDPDYNGLDSFTYKVFDGELYSEIATVSITIAAVNDAPVAYGATVETTENTAVEFELLASDPDGDLETYIIVNMPGHGSLVCDGKYCIYTPEAHWFGTDNLVFKVFDGEFYSEKATVYLQVLAWPRIYLPLIFR